MSDHEARFLGFDSPDARIFDVLSTLPDGVGVAEFYRLLGAEYAELVRREGEQVQPDAQ